ncbi:hypothetical protein LCI18_012298 [Fusarium solani-melongenae]|uniref:Uncharacterized protein n=1 Tax=Fusarium solani subsp. cucurbitae TaxID=2747967 RepID=A0ACD3ZJ79_FUSSC|nr:hypothetical protein LCI18_012298 [Fusarium solani-melongenae]
MSTSFLSRQDIESWVPDAATSKGGVGFVAKLSTSISRAIASLREALVGRQDEACRMCQNELERFLLWCQGLDVADGRLDELLSRSKELHHQVLSLLLRLGTSILQAISQALVEPSQLQLNDCDHLKALLDVAETMLKGPDSDEHERPDTPSGSDESNYGLLESIEEISAYVDCLLDLAPALDNPALDTQMEDPKEPPFDTKESFTASCEEALIYCRKIRDRFDALPRYLVERLAEANVLRATEIREMQRPAIVKETPINDTVTESLFTRKCPQITETTKSSVLPPSVFSSALASSSKWSAQPASTSRRVDLAEFDDNASKATFASFSTAASSIAMGRPRVPPMPDVQEGGVDCTVCLTHLTDAMSRKQWKRHVFNDLRPYMCTVEDCQMSGTLYKHSRTWASHESIHLPAASKSAECAFCFATYQRLNEAYYKHVSGHLREISLSVLPQTIDDDAESGTDESDSLVNDHSKNESEEHLPASAQKITEEFFNPGELESILKRLGASDRESDQRDPEEEDLEEEEFNGRRLEEELDARGLEQQLFEPRPRSTVLFENDEERLDRILNELLGTRYLDPETRIDLQLTDIQFLCTKAKRILISQSTLLKLTPPLTVVGPIHGHFYDLLKVFDCAGSPKETSYLFLGNYVDCGIQSLGTICLLLAYMIKSPRTFFLLQGNHESEEVSRRQLGFYQECKRHDIWLWERFVDIFNYLPLAATVNNRIFCVHGGLGEISHGPKYIEQIFRPTSVKEEGILRALLRGDFDDDIIGWNDNGRDGVKFGPDHVSTFLTRHNLDLIVSGRKFVKDGYQFCSDRKFLRLWTAPNWEGSGNMGAIWTIPKDFKTKIQVCLARFMMDL